MHILYLADIRFPLERANGIQTMETCHGLASRGHQVTMMVRRDTAAPARDPFVFYDLRPLPQLRIERISVPGRSTVRRLAYLSAAVCRSFGPARADIVFTRDLGCAAVLSRVARRLRPRLVYESHGFAPSVGMAMSDLLTGGRSAGERKRRRLLARERRVWQHADGYVTITAGLATELAARFRSRAMLAVVPDGVRLKPDRVFAQRIPSRPPVVAYAGHLYPWKGVDVLLQALSQLPDVDGLIVGGHPGEPDLERTKALAGTLGISGRVTFAGLVRPGNVPALIATADVLVLPNTATSISTAYTSPLKLFEYMAAGKPIVASGLPSIREVLRDGESAVLVEPGNADALAAGIRHVLDDKALAERVAHTAFELAASYGWDRRAERLEALFEAVAGGS